MANPASTTDVEKRWRPLTAPETIVATTRLEDAWRKLQRDVPGIEARFTTEVDLEAEAVKVLADAVIRVLQSTSRDGLRKFSLGVDDANRSGELDESVRASLYFADDELAGLSPAGDDKPRVFSVVPS